MTPEQRMRAFMGSLILIGLGLSYVASTIFVILPVLVAVDLVQSAFTGYFPVQTFLTNHGNHVDSAPTGKPAAHA